MSIDFSRGRTLHLSGLAMPQLRGQPALQPVKLSGREAINELFDYRLTLATPDELNWIPSEANNFRLDSFVGQELTVGIELEGSGTFVPGAKGASGFGNIGAGTREISALVVVATLVGEEGRSVFYELTLRPWLHLATLRVNCRIFQDKTVVEVIDALFEPYFYSIDKRLIETYPPRDYTTQFNESDFAFFSRLCEKWGISYFFEHSEGKHRLVLIDGMGAYKNPPSEAYRTLNFYPPGRKIDEEFIEAFSPDSRLTSGIFTTRDYDYTRPRADLTVARSDPRDTANARQEVCEFHQDARYAQPKAGAGQVGNDAHQEGDFIALLRMQALRSTGRRAAGFGHLRGIVPGTTFKLQRYPQDAANIEYLVLSTTFEIEEAAEESQSAGRKAGQRFRVDVRFEVHPLREAYRPERVTPLPDMRGLQTAVVVGPEGQDLWTDSLGRVKVQFHWDRLGKRDQNSSCWMRVAEAWAGNQLGSTFIPRIGQELLVSFINSDPDRPVCTGRVYNQNNLPPLKQTDNQSVSIIRSRELVPGGGNSAAGRSNHLALDDTAGHIQAQLKSDHQASQLLLGDIASIEGNAGRGQARGEGFELATDAHGVLRAQRGMLLTTEGRPNAQAPIKSMGETTGRLTQAREQHETLADMARQAGAQAAGADQGEVAEALKAQNAELRGGDAKFPELAKPHVVISSPAGIAATAAGSTHLHSEGHTAVTTGKHLSLGVQGSWFGTVLSKMAFVASKAISLVSRKGPIRVEAQSDMIELVAQRVLSLLSTDDWITASGSEGILLNAGGSYCRMTPAGIELGTKGFFLVHAANVEFTGPQNISAASRTWLLQQVR